MKIIIIKVICPSIYSIVHENTQVLDSKFVLVTNCQFSRIRGRPLMIWGGAEEIEKKKCRRPSSREKNYKGFLQEKNKFTKAFSRKKKFEKASPRTNNCKKAFRRKKKIWRGSREDKINSFSNFPPAPPPRS